MLITLIPKPSWPSADFRPRFGLALSPILGIGPITDPLAEFRPLAREVAVAAGLAVSRCRLALTDTPRGEVR